jgi:hypothetical protein
MAFFTMTNNKSKKQGASTKSVTQSQKKSAKSGATSRTLAPTSRILRATSRTSLQPSRHATVEESDDEDEVSHVGGTLNTDGDRVMEQAGMSDSKE